MFRNRIHFLKSQASILQYACSFVYLALYIGYFFVKYGKLETMFLLAGTRDGLLGKVGNPMAYKTF